MKIRLLRALVLVTAMAALTVAVSLWDNVKAADAPNKETSAYKDKQRLLETVGSLAAAHYYQTYLNIGFIADGKSAGLYGDKDARRILDSILSLLDTVDQQLEKVSRVDVEREDRNSLQQMQKVSSLLRDQGKELKAFWDSGDEGHSARYEEIRKNAWASLRKLMGLG